MVRLEGGRRDGEGGGCSLVEEIEGEPSRTSQECTMPLSSPGETASEEERGQSRRGLSSR